MKNFIIRLLHAVLGYERYLRYFTRFRINNLKHDSRKQEYLYFEKLLADDANIVVIGANTGITTIPFALGKKKRNILAYEPVPSNYRVLKKTISHYSLDNIKAYQLALGKKAGEAEIVLPVHGGAKKHGMAHIKTPSIASAGEGPTFTVDVDVLDNRVELQDIKIDAIKLVAENYEKEILEGAKKLIEQHKPFIYCELWDNENRRPTMALIESYGYKIYYREQQDLKPYEGSNYSGKNFFFKPHNE